MKRHSDINHDAVIVWQRMESHQLSTEIQKDSQVYRRPVWVAMLEFSYPILTWDMALPYDTEETEEMESGFGYKDVKTGFNLSIKL